VATDFPNDAIAIRRVITFTHENATIDGDLLYEPASGDGPWPLLLIVYPSPAIRWEKATIQFAAAGYTVLAISPDEERGLDLEAHARDLRIALHYAQQGSLTQDIAGPDFIMLTGSFGSLIGYRALPDLNHLRAIVNIGGVSDGFLGVQSLYSETLAIPPPYDLAVASMGRPDRDPGFFLAYSPTFFAGHHPPTLLIHTYEDEVIPYNQSQRLADALSEAGVPNELHLYHSKTHYLDPRTPSDEAYVVFELVLDFIQHWFPLDPS
jgi:dipeptidyl aminopeptidase/acylaminoacyl peptidase